MNIVKVSKDTDLTRGDPVLKEANISAISPGVHFGFIQV